MKITRLLALIMVYIALPTTVFANTNGEVHSIHIVRADTNAGITANVVLVQNNYKEKNLGRANNGILHLSKPVKCTQGMTLKVFPSAAWYNDTTKSMECKKKEYVYLEAIQFSKRESFRQKKHRVVITIAANTTSATRADDYALLALLYSELAAEIRSLDRTLFELYSKRIIENYALATNYIRSVSGIEIYGKYSDDFRSFILNRQSLNNIPGTGKLDYKTLSFEANRNIHWFRYHVYTDVTKVPKIADEAQFTKAKLLKSIRKNIELNSTVKYLLMTAESKEQIGKYGDASLLFNEASARGGASWEVGGYAARKAFMNAGKVLGVDSAARYDPQQMKYVMTEEMVGALIGYQKTKNFSASGQLDYKTIRSFSESGIGAYLDEHYRGLGHKIP